MKQSLSADTDIVILQFGDNLNTDEKRKNLETDIPNLVSWIRAVSPRALIYWVGIYYASPDFLDRVKRICEPLDITFVDIYKYSKDAIYKSEMNKVLRLPDGSNYTITNQGVASHPGDIGHKAIADEIIKNFLF
ncbi:SGNH/GDSL hydrolase family protein [Streptococcus lactarius]